MDASTQVAIERAKAERKSPVVLWLVNFNWPGLGNLVVGQTGLGILFGLLEWVCIGVAVLTLGLAQGCCWSTISWPARLASRVSTKTIRRHWDESSRQVRIGGRSMAEAIAAGAGR